MWSAATEALILIPVIGACAQVAIQRRRSDFSVCGLEGELNEPTQVSTWYQMILNGIKWYGSEQWDSSFRDILNDPNHWVIIYMSMTQREVLDTAFVSDFHAPLAGMLLTGLILWALDCINGRSTCAVRWQIPSRACGSFCRRRLSFKVPQMHQTPEKIAAIAASVVFDQVAWGCGSIDTLMYLMWSICPCLKP